LLNAADARTNAVPFLEHLVFGPSDALVDHGRDHGVNLLRMWCLRCYNWLRLRQGAGRGQLGGVHEAQCEASVGAVVGGVRAENAQYRRQRRYGCVHRPGQRRPGHGILLLPRRVAVDL